MPLRPLLGSPSEEPQDDPSGSPIVVLMKIRAEGSPVVVDIEQTYRDVSGGADIQSAAHFNRKTAGRSLVTASPADGSVRTGSSHQRFRKRGYSPSISPVAEQAGPVMISVEDILGTGGRDDVVAAVGNDLQPRCYVPANRSQCAV